MPVVAVANSKGGSGKSTTALLLACELSEGSDVVLIDADPRRPLAAWARLPGVPTRVRVIESAGERGILDEIQKAAAAVPFVVIDLEGTASRLTSYAVSQADLVLIPTQEQIQDAQAALDTLAEIKRDAQAVRRHIASAIVLTRTRAAVKSRTARHVSKELRNSGAVQILTTEIVERDAYASIFASGGSVRNLDPADVNNLPAAIENARRLAAEVVGILRNTVTKEAEH